MKKNRINIIFVYFRVRNSNNIFSILGGNISLKSLIFTLGLFPTTTVIVTVTKYYYPVRRIILFAFLIGFFSVIHFSLTKIVNKSPNET